ncbi:ECF transporter S component [Alloscardovia theropitheci]|uniref:ECF transporter S component n=1 Tax=Alloscardovia theropitheci TaxID=2496842 RepID=A0A4R0QQL2_9BIFI|nr:ECF transporter S component [Alloscardovia theropitheci]TCD53608.1 ECF transporter S component [Alloscardovia theropitheci]
MTSYTQNSDNSHSQSTNSQSNQETAESLQPYWTSQRIAIYALFTTLAIVLSFIQIPIFPAAPFLRYDPSGIVVLLAGFAYGPLAAVIISVLSALPHVFTNPFGGLILIACSIAFSVPSAWLYSRNRTRKTAIISMIVGAVCFIATAIILNLIITPFYTATPLSAVIAMIVPILLPFNLLKAGIHLIITMVCYKPITGLLKSFTASQTASRRV